MVVVRLEFRLGWESGWVGGGVGGGCYSPGLRRRVIVGSGGVGSGGRGGGMEMVIDGGASW